MSVTLEVVVEDVVLGTPGTLSETVDSRSPVEILADEYIFNPSTIASTVEVVLEDLDYRVANASVTLEFPSSDIEVLLSDAVINNGTLLEYSGTFNILNSQDRPIEVYVTDKIFGLDSAGYELIIEDIVFDNIVIGEQVEVAVYAGLASTNANEVAFNNPGSDNVINPSSVNIQSALLDVESRAASKAELTDYIAKTESLLEYLDPAQTRTHLQVYSVTEANSTFVLKSSNLGDVPDKAQARTNLDVYSKSESSGLFLVKSANLADVPNKAEALANLGALTQTSADSRYVRGINNLSDLSSYTAARTNLGVYSKGEVEALIAQGVGDGTVLVEGSGINVTANGGGEYEIAVDLLGLQNLVTPGSPKLFYHNGTTSSFVGLNPTLSVIGGNLAVVSAPKLSLAKTIQLTGFITSPAVPFDGSENITITTTGDTLPAHTHPISEVVGLQAALDSKANTSHSHSITDVTGLQAALDSKASTAVATTSASGLMSATDKTKLDGIATNANNYVHPTGDGDSHVPATGTTNSGRVLMAGATANSASWQSLAISNVTGLQTALDNKASFSHQHAIADVSGLQTALDSKAATAHSHSISQVTGLQAALDNKANNTLATHSANGLMSSSDYSKLWGIAPTSESTSGMVLFSGAGANNTFWSGIGIVDVVGLQGALSAKQEVLISGSNIKTVNGQSILGSGNLVVTAEVGDIYIADVIGLQTALDSKASTEVATASANGLMSAADKAKLNGIASGANNYIHPTGDGYSHVPPTGTTNEGKVLMAGGTPDVASWQKLAISDIFNLQTALDAKADLSHMHGISSVAGLQAALDGKAPSSHSHTIAEVSGLQTSLDSKASIDYAGIVIPAGLNGGVGGSLKSQLSGSEYETWMTSRPNDVTTHKAVGVNDVIGPVYWDGTSRQYIWHTGNDGGGSGLDADMLDGRHANGFMLSEAGDYSSDAVPWNAQSGVYRNLHSGWQSLIAHFRAPDGSTPAMQLKSTYMNGGLWYRSARDHFGFENDWAQVATGNLPFQFWGDNYVDFGPNSNWGGMLRVGGNGRTDATKASVHCSNGNLHLDPKDGHHLYLNYHAPVGALTYFQRGGESYFLASNGDINARVVGALRFAAGADWGIDFSMMCTNWFRSVGNTGWFNQTYGGGIWMQDETWIRTYGNKKFHVDNTARDAVLVSGGFESWSTKAFNYAGKCAIGGMNDEWLRLNPDSEFTSGIYAGTSILRTDGELQIGPGGSSFNAGNGFVNSNGVFRGVGYSTSWGITNGASTGAFNAIMGTGAAATWLLSGTSSGTFRCGIQALDSNGALRFYAGSGQMQWDGSTLSATFFSGNGSGLTNLNGSNITTGTVETARIAGGATGKSILAAASVTSVRSILNMGVLVFSGSVASGTGFNISSYGSGVFSAVFVRTSDNVRYTATLFWDGASNTTLASSLDGGGLAPSVMSGVLKNPASSAYNLTQVMKLA